MLWLTLVSLLWGFSFGLIKTNLNGLDPVLLSGIRLFLAFLLFLPFQFVGPKAKIGGWPQLQLLLIGSIQFGAMYCALFQAFHYLKGYEVAIWTIFTPLYVMLADRWFSREGHSKGWLAAVIAVLGAACISYRSDLSIALRGILWIQVANICFAVGQIFWRDWKKTYPHIPAPRAFGTIYLGAFLLPVAVALYQGTFDQIGEITPTQWGALIYLGVVASGLCFFLWNFGATQVKPDTLAVFNNLKIPLAILVSITVFREEANWIQLIPGALLLLLALSLSTKRIQS